MIHMPKVEQARVSYLDDKLPTYTSMGGYPIYYVSYTTSEVVCPVCANEITLDDDLVLEDYDINYDNEELYCDMCNELIECAYPSEEKES